MSGLRRDYKMQSAKRKAQNELEIRNELRKRVKIAGNLEYREAYHPCPLWRIGRGTVPFWVNHTDEYISGGTPLY